MQKLNTIDNPKLIFVVGGIGLGINIVGLLLFGDLGHGHSHGGDGHNHGHGHGHDNPSYEDTFQIEQEENKNQKSKKSVNNHKSEFKCPSFNQPHLIHEFSSLQNLSGHQMNITGVFLHVLSDALGSVAVMISAAVIWLTDWEYR